MIVLGVAGPCGNEYEHAFAFLEQNRLFALEVEFTHGIRMKKERASQIRRSAQQHTIQLSVHAPYYINLASLEQEKIIASKQRIIASCEMAHHLGARYVVFHAGHYQKRDPAAVYEIIKGHIKDILAVIRKEGWDVFLAPETTGKISQFGNLDELLKLREETGCEICIDFSHILAREGSVDYDEVLSKTSSLKQIHGHLSGIEYGQKGERRHIMTSPEAIRELLDALLRHKKKATIINESPDPFGDTLMSRKILDGLLARQ